LEAKKLRAQSRAFGCQRFEVGGKKAEGSKLK
jgi:hypothetical protein